MADKGLESFDRFVAGVLSKITDPDQKRKAEEAITALKTVEPVARALGDGVVGQSELSRQLDELRTKTEELNTRATDLDSRTAGLQEWHENLTSWYQQNKDALAAARNGKPNGKDSKVEPPAGSLTEEQFNERIGGERAAFLGFSRDQNQLTRDHFAKFSEIVDLEPLLKHPKIAEVGLLGVYELVHKDRLDKWKTDAAAAAEEKIRLDERQKVQASMAQMPYPTPTGVGSGSPLDALEAGKKEPVVDAAVAHYNRLQQEHLGTVPAK